jgi:rSAM/selenodomain-associated transferase 1
LSGRNKDNGPAIIVMAKAPLPGTVKTRLSGAYSDVEIVALASAFLADTVAAAKLIGPHVFIAYSPEGGRSIIEPIAGGGVEWICQLGADLGERMYAAFAEAFEQGFTPLVIVGTDSPHMPTASYQAAMEILQGREADIVLGPADDGGFTLIGVSAPNPALFEGVLWSGPTVLKQTTENAERAGLQVRTIAPWYDVDTPEDLQRLRDDLLAVSAHAAQAPATSAWLRSHMPPSDWPPTS